MFFQLRFFDPSASAATISTQAGVIIGAKTAAQVCTGMLWGRLADYEFGGRKTVLMIGLLSSGIASIGYGFSTTFISAVLWQVFGGAMSSNVGITRCVVAELNPEKRCVYLPRFQIVHFTEPTQLSYSGLVASSIICKRGYADRPFGRRILELQSWRRSSQGISICSTKRIRSDDLHRCSPWSLLRG